MEIISREIFPLAISMQKTLCRNMASNFFSSSGGAKLNMPLPSKAKLLAIASEDEPHFCLDNDDVFRHQLLVAGLSAGHCFLNRAIVCTLPTRLVERGVRLEGAQS
jgi:hypothetical protein